MNYSPLLRQFLVAGASQLAAFSVGGVVGFPGVLLHQFRANDSSIHLNLDTASWIGSLHGLAGIPSILMPIMMQWRGRKFAFIVACFLITMGWVLVCAATSIAHILLSEVFHGLGTNSILAVSMLSMGEMVTPKYRNMSLLSFTIIQALGMALVGIISRYMHWKSVAVLMCVPVIVALLVACMWPESPSWLACKGEFDKCERAFKWLRGSDELCLKELDDLISAQKEILHSASSSKCTLKTFWRTITRRDFYMPGLHMFVLLNMMYWSGIMVILIYSIEMIEKVTLNQSAAFAGGILMSSILFVSYTITVGLIRRFDNKPVLLLSALGTSTCLIGASVITYMQSRDIVARDSMICLYCLIGTMICSSLGINSLVFTVAAELMPVKHRGLGGSLYVIYTCILHTTSLKLSPYLFLYISMSGTFLLYTINAILCGLFIWKYIPETKGRTLQEIEDFYVFGKFVKSRINEDSRSTGIAIGEYE